MPVNRPMTWARVKNIARGIYGAGWNGAGKHRTSFFQGNASSATLEQVLENSGITPIADGTYTLGIGGSQNGTITTKSGIIIAKTEALP